MSHINTHTISPSKRRGKMVTPVQRLADGLGRNQRQNDSSNRFNGERVLIGVVSRLKTGTVDVREVNTAGRQWTVENVEPIFSQHPLSVGDQVIVWRGSNGRNICAGLLRGQVTDGTFRNGFFARVIHLGRKLRAGPIPDDIVAIQFMPLLPTDIAGVIGEPWALVSKEGATHAIGDIVYVTRDFGSIIPQTLYTLDEPLYFATAPLYSNRNDYENLVNEDGQAISSRIVNPFDFVGIGIEAEVLGISETAITGSSITPTFDPDTTSYIVNLPAGSSSATINVRHITSIAITANGSTGVSISIDTPTDNETDIALTSLLDDSFITFISSNATTGGRTEYTLTFSIG